MQIYGYHRTSTKEQHLDRGIQEIERYCNEHEMALTNIFTDQETGKNFNRPRYTVLVEDVLRLGDILIVTELDRLGRNKHDTMQQIQRIKDMGVRLMVLELPTTLMDLSVMDNAMARMMLETINNMMLELYASMAQAELEKKEKRQREGIEAKKLRGEWDDYGRPSVMKQETFDENFQSVISSDSIKIVQNKDAMYTQIMYDKKDDMKEEAQSWQKVRNMISSLRRTQSGIVWIIRNSHSRKRLKIWESVILRSKHGSGQPRNMKAVCQQEDPAIIPVMRQKRSLVSNES